MWLTNGGSSTLVAVLVLTPGEAAEGASVYKKMTTFLVEKPTGFGEVRPGLTIPGKIEKMGYKGVDTTELVMDGLRLPADDHPRRRAGQGLLPDDGRRRGRAASTSPPAPAGCRIRAFELGIEYAQQRVTFGKPIIEHQAVSFRLADMAVKVEAAHQMMVMAARKKDAGERNDMEAGMAKYLASRVLQGGRRGLVPHPRRLRLLQGVRDRAPLPRGPDAAHRRGHRGHPAHDHRPPPARGIQVPGMTDAPPSR